MDCYFCACGVLMWDLYFDPKIDSMRSCGHLLSNRLEANCRLKSMDRVAKPEGPNCVYPRSPIAAGLALRPQRLRVLSTSERIARPIYSEAGLTHQMVSESANWLPFDDTIIVVPGLVCLPCACRAAMDLLNKAFDGPNLRTRRAILID